MKTLFRLTAAFAIASFPVISPADEANTLTKEEKEAGWQLLFDGRDTSKWKSFGSEEFPSQGWEVSDGWLVKKGGVKGGNLVTTEEFTDFEFSWEWRMTEGGNNGVKYFLDEERGNLGHEYQMLAQPGKEPTKNYTA